MKETERIKCMKEHVQEQKGKDKEKVLPQNTKGFPSLFAECTPSLIMIKVAIMINYPI